MTNSGTNFVANPTIVAKKPPRPVPNTRNAAIRAGHVSPKNLPIASIFLLFSLSPNHSISFFNTLPMKIVVIKLNNFSNNDLTGAITLSVAFANPLNTFDSNFFSFFALPSLSLDRPSLIAAFFFTFCCSLKDSKIESIPFSMSLLFSFLSSSLTCGTIFFGSILDFLKVSDPPSPTAPGRRPLTFDDSVADSFLSKIFLTKLSNPTLLFLFLNPSFLFSFDKFLPPIVPSAVSSSTYCWYLSFPRNLEPNLPAGISLFLL